MPQSLSLVLDKLLQGLLGEKKDLQPLDVFHFLDERAHKTKQPFQWPFE